ncbi:ABC transporter permease [Paenibacillus sp. YIM B09110]|uniref:ABC transporter permease n=1 Tax=Paenibacillus sp. YIM B09110 TaxID=3126102 RepID=UPI00301E0F65
MKGFRSSNTFPLHMMLLPAVLLVLIYSYGPMIGVAISFQDFIPAKGLFGEQDWVGWDNFKYVFNMPNFMQVIMNTITIALFKIVLILIVPILFSLLINEIKGKTRKKLVQTSIYLPHFLSWVILAGILLDVLSPSTGIINKFLSVLGIEPIFFLGDNNWFQFTIITSDIWKEFGFSTIIYLAAITGINPSYYEAAVIDGANRYHMMRYITLPAISYVIVLLGVLSLGNVLNAGFDQIFNLYSPQVYESGDILDTFVYRFGLMDAQFGPATAVGLFKSVVSFVFITVSYWIAVRFANYRIF